MIQQWKAFINSEVAADQSRAKMFNLFKEIKGLSKLETIKTDDTLFRLFYKGTVLVYFIFLVALGATENFGDPIICDSSSNDVRYLYKDVVSLKKSWYVKVVYVSTHLVRPSIQTLIKSKTFSLFRKKIDGCSLYLYPCRTRIHNQKAQEIVALSWARMTWPS